MAAATTPSPSTGSTQLTCELSSVTDDDANRSGISRAAPTSAMATAPVTIPPQVSTTGGSTSEPSLVDVVEDWKKYTAIDTAAASAYSTPTRLTPPDPDSCSI